MKKILEEKKEVIISIIIVILAIIGFAVRVNQVEEKKSNYDSDWRYHHYSRSYANNTNANDNSVNQVDSDNSYNNNSTVDDDPYGKKFYDDADDFADDNAEEFGDGDEDDGWDDAYDYYEEENKR